jgi:hypothetical protein
LSSKEFDHVIIAQLVWNRFENSCNLMPSLFTHACARAHAQHTMQLVLLCFFSYTTCCNTTCCRLAPAISRAVVHLHLAVREHPCHRRRKGEEHPVPSSFVVVLAATDRCHCSVPWRPPANWIAELVLIMPVVFVCVCVCGMDLVERTSGKMLPRSHQRRLGPSVLRAPLLGARPLERLLALPWRGSHRRVHWIVATIPERRNSSYRRRDPSQ